MRKVLRESHLYPRSLCLKMPFQNEGTGSPLQAVRKVAEHLLQVTLVSFRQEVSYPKEDKSGKTGKQTTPSAPGHRASIGQGSHTRG